MYDVIFYRDSKGNEPTAEFISNLRRKSVTDKNARINLNKIVAYINLLSKHGTWIGEPVRRQIRYHRENWNRPNVTLQITSKGWEDKMSTNWKDFKKSLNLTPEEEELIRLEESLIMAVVEAREKSGMTQKQLSELCGIKQPIIARLENAAHSPQINSMIRILKPLGYTLAVVPDGNVQKLS